MRVAYLWTGDERIEAHNAEMTPGRMHMNVLPALLGYDVLHWDERASWAGEYDLIIVQYFTREYSVIAPVREKFPSARIALRMDRPPEWIVRNRADVLPALLRDMMQADVIVGALPDGRRASFWAQAVSKPTAILPTPIVPHPDVEMLRKQDREDLLVGWLHPADEQHHLPTLATLVALQRQTGIAVTVINGTDADQTLARQLGLRADWQPSPAHEGFIDLLSLARLVVDVFPMHTPGRVASVAAYLGTPTVTAFDTPDIGHPRVDAWSGDGVEAALKMLNDTVRRKTAIRGGIAAMERHSPASIRAAVERLAGVSYETPDEVTA